MSWHSLHHAKLPLHNPHILQTSCLDNSKQSHTGDLHKGLNLGFRATGLKSGTVMAVAAKAVVVSSAEVTVEVVVIASNDNDEGDPDKAEDI